MTTPTNMNEVPKERILEITSLLLCQAQYNVLEELKYTSAAKGELRKINNQMIIQLSKYVSKKTAKLWEVDDTLTMKLVKGIEDVGKGIAKASSPEIFAILKTLMGKTPEELQHYVLVDKTEYESLKSKK